MTTIGILALQGDVREHAHAIERLGASAVGVRRLSELDAVDGLIIPGGESTTIDKLLRIFELFDPLKQRLDEGLPVLGTCAGMIMLASDIIGAIEGQRSLGVIPMTVRRNAFGRQVDSSEVELTWRPDGSTMHATFIRAPWVESSADAVEVLAVDEAHGGQTVAVRHRNAIATSFHPEIVAPGATPDDRVHQVLLDLVASRR
ncbi:pyridoxal 5'-phosphate synthase glutaminase subunit PdxT [Demequina zhanjiangensis]|uniref:Pyridoxal 5'-phosphate synthase subunit PdxT n=1 Tax=Demequina zhanjiangensis TaxID=3051659 RepID=A0ABT8G1C6_9MICO|nr:pyridoxal 5'-phosphate synthase glutaminase subunit PdxT [Demequina sp. SYSU T00b26]MDN4472764.1 pyridoxal 5'-phosphate synthase glutaminase subunit PdxT [Demequina sp. SYSU T00b26]